MNEREAARAKIIAAYKSGLTLRQVGEKIGVSMQRVHQVISTYAPELMRPRFDRRSRTRDA